MAEPTPFDDLNHILGDLVASIQAILEENFCGAYLVGSFAIGDADIHSDVDFIVVTHDEVTQSQQKELQEMHRRIYRLDSAWAQHLEGSYIPKESLRRLDPNGRSYLYLDNGTDELILSDHCNSAVVRWSLREHGVVLAGPQPAMLIDPVGMNDLRNEMSTKIHDLAEYARSDLTFAVPGTSEMTMSRWMQTYAVMTVCRTLHTFQSGRVTSKNEAATWATESLDAKWRSLIQEAVADRANPWERVHQPAEPERTERTLAFIDYGLGLVPPSSSELTL